MTIRQSILRARMGLYLNGPMPTIQQIMWKFRMRKSAAGNWHWKIAKARREFAS